MKRLALITLLALPLPAAAQETAQEERDVGLIQGFIEENLSGVSRTVRIEGFDGALSSRATIERLTIADEQGVWLRAEDLVLDWNRSALLRGRVEVNEMTAGLIALPRTPIAEATAPSPEATPFALPELPVSIRVDELRADRIELGAPLVGQELILSLTGSASLADGDGQASLQADRLEGQEGSFALTGSYSNETDILDLDLTFAEAEDGIVATRLGIPGAPSLTLALQGTGPLSDYTADLQLATGGVDRITGEITTATDDAGRRFRLDIDGDIAPLFAPEFEEFFGPDVSLDVAGRRAGDGSLSLDTLDLSTDALTLSGSAEIDPDQWPRRLDLTGELRHPDGGPVTIPASGDPITVGDGQLSVQFDAAEDDRWTAEIQLSQIERPGLAIDRLRLDGGGLIRRGERFTATLDYGAEGLTLDDVGAAEALGSAITGGLRLAAPAGAPIEITEFSLTGAGLALGTTATIDRDDGFRTAYDLSATVEDLARFSTLAGRELSGDITLTSQGTVTPLDGSFDLTIDGDTGDLGIGIAEVDGLIDGDGSLALSATRDTDGTRIENLRIETDDALITGSADLSSDGSDASVEAAIRDLSAVRDGLSGRAELRGDLAQTADGGLTVDIGLTGPGGLDTVIDATVAPRELARRISGTARISADDLSPYATLAPNGLGGAVSVELVGGVTPETLLFDGRISGVTSDLQTGLADLDRLLDGTGRLDIAARRDRDGITLDRLRVAYPLLSADLTGQATEPGPIDGPPSLDTLGTVSLAGSVNAEDLSVFSDLAGRPLDGSVSLTLDASAEPEDLFFDIDVTGTTEDLAAGIPQLDPLIDGRGIITARASRDAEALRIDDLRLDFVGIDLTASGSTAEGAGRGRFDLRVPDLSLIDAALSGAASVTGTADRSATGVWSIDADATGPGGLDALIDAEVGPREDGFPLRADANLRASNLSAYRQIAGLPLSGAVEAQTTVRGTLENGTYDITANATTQSLAIGQQAVDTLLAGSGRITFQGARRADGTLVLDQFDAVYPNITVDADGSLDGGTSRARFDARLADIGLFVPELSGPATADGTATLRPGGEIVLDAALTGPAGTRATVAGTIQGNNLNLRTSGAVPLGLANPFVEPRQLSGTAQFDLSVAGPPALSSVSGRIATSGARVSLPTLGRAAENVALTANLAGGTATLETTGRVSTGGTIAASGTIGLDAPFPANLTARLNQASLIDPQLYETTVDGQVSIQGPLAGGAAISGQIDLGTSEIRIPSSSLGGLGTLPDIVHVNPPPAVQETRRRAGLLPSQQAETGTGTTRPYPLDILVRAPARIFVRGRGLDAELGGQLRIGGTTAEVIPQGRFELIRGRLDILGQRFQLDEGAITLLGDFVPNIRLVAVTETDTTTISIIVEGSIDDPDIRFTSSPELPEEEVLAQLLFGRDLDSISPLQAVQLASAVSTLAGGGGGGLVGDLREQTGLADLDITTGEDGSAALRAGAYLSENIYTDVTVGSTGDAEISLNLDITRSLTARGTVGSDGETGLGIFFERDY
ncbi:translocation/assembly module TamB domain-containing protein [Aestuariibius sp. 2305UL40-4]|uniref:translocation/assembly module TamB domain-containing protein n=1 Tax=Aestuariibius violaceus TaxID=3234132 RepID=UPI00345EB82E